MIDPETGWINIAQVPGNHFSSARVYQQINQHWLTRYPRVVIYIYDNASEVTKIIENSWSHLISNKNLQGFKTHKLTTL